MSTYLERPLLHLPILFSEVRLHFLYTSTYIYSTIIFSMLLQHIIIIVLYLYLELYITLSIFLEDVLFTSEGNPHEWLSTRNLQMDVLHVFPKNWWLSPDLPYEWCTMVFYDIWIFQAQNPVLSLVDVMGEILNQSKYLYSRNPL